MIKISIIIPVYNVEHYLNETVNSVLRQSHKNIEVLLINDGSTDNSRSICEEYAKKYNFIYLINQENGGVSAAKNVGIENATGNYIMFLDSDDYWENDLLENIIDTFKDNESIDYMFFRFSEYYQKKGVKKELFNNINSSKVNESKGSEVLSYILDKEKYFPWYVWASIIKTDFIKSNNLLFEKGRTYEDVLWTPNILLKAKNVRFVDKALYVYRRDREGQITSDFSYKNLRDSIYVSEYWIKNSHSLVTNEELRKKLIENVIVRYFFAIWFSGYLNKQEKGLIFKELKEARYLLDYRDAPIQRITYIMVKSLGFSRTSFIFKLLINTKRFLSNG